MKIFGLALLLAALRLAAADEPAAPAPPRAVIQLSVQVVGLPIPLAVDLVPKLRDPATAQAAHARLQEMLARNEAVLLGWPTVVMDENARGTSSAGNEHRYPTEFEPPTLPGDFGSFSRPFAPPSFGASAPTAFETRDTGNHLEVTATLDKLQQTIRLTGYRQELVHLLPLRRWEFAPDVYGIRSVIEQPDFRTERSTSSCTLRPGEPALLGTFVVSRPAPQVILFVARAFLKPLPPEASALQP